MYAGVLTRNILEKSVSFSSRSPNGRCSRRAPVEFDLEKNPSAKLTGASDILIGGFSAGGIPNNRQHSRLKPSACERSIRVTSLSGIGIHAASFVSKNTGTNLSFSPGQE